MRLPRSVHFGIARLLAALVLWAGSVTLLAHTAVGTTLGDVCSANPPGKSAGGQDPRHASTLCAICIGAAQDWNDAAPPALPAEALLARRTDARDPPGSPGGRPASLPLPRGPPPEA